MTVNPGFGHQPFLRTTLPTIGRVRELVDRLNPGCEVEVDGGIDAMTAPLVVRAAPPYWWRARQSPATATASLLR